MEYIINAIGGYNSVGFVIVMILCLVVGTPLIRLHWAFITLPIFGCLLMLEFIKYEAGQIQDPPLVVEITPLLFAIAVIVGVFWGFTRKNKTTKQPKLG